jgi:hypothetical protein
MIMVQKNIYHNVIKLHTVLSQQCEHILLLTATPHRGRTDTFKMLLQF